MPGSRAHVTFPRLHGTHAVPRTDTVRSGPTPRIGTRCTVATAVTRALPLRIGLPLGWTRLYAPLRSTVYPHTLYTPAHLPGLRTTRGCCGSQLLPTRYCSCCIVTHCAVYSWIYLVHTHGYCCYTDAVTICTFTRICSYTHTRAGYCRGWFTQFVRLPCLHARLWFPGCYAHIYVYVTRSRYTPHYAVTGFYPCGFTHTPDYRGLRARICCHARLHTRYTQLGWLRGLRFTFRLPGYHARAHTAPGYAFPVGSTRTPDCAHTFTAHATRTPRLVAGSAPAVTHHCLCTRYPHTGYAPRAHLRLLRSHTAHTRFAGWVGSRTVTLYAVHLWLRTRLHGCRCLHLRGCHPRCCLCLLRFARWFWFGYTVATPVAATPRFTHGLPHLYHGSRVAVVRCHPALYTYPAHRTRALTVAVTRLRFTPSSLVTGWFPVCHIPRSRTPFDCPLHARLRALGSHTPRTRYCGCILPPFAVWLVYPFPRLVRAGYWLLPFGLRFTHTRYHTTHTHGHTRTHVLFCGWLHLRFTLQFVYGWLHTLRTRYAHGFYGSRFTHARLPAVTPTHPAVTRHPCGSTLRVYGYRGSLRTPHPRTARADLRLRALLVVAQFTHVTRAFTTRGQFTVRFAVGLRLDCVTTRLHTDTICSGRIYAQLDYYTFRLVATARLRLRCVQVWIGRLPQFPFCGCRTLCLLHHTRFHADYGTPLFGYRPSCTHLCHTTFCRCTFAIWTLQVERCSWLPV